MVGVPSQTVPQPLLAERGTMFDIPRGMRGNRVRGVKGKRGKRWKLKRAGGRRQQSGRAAQGVMLVSVGSNRRSAAPKGATRAHVARIHDLPSLIHAFIAEG